MSRIHIALSRVDARSTIGAVLPLANSVEVGAETLTSSATSQLSALTGGLGEYWTVTADGGPVFLKFGPGTPVAVSGAGHLLLSGQTADFAVSTASEKLACVDA